MRQSKDAAKDHVVNVLGSSDGFATRVFAHFPRMALGFPAPLAWLRRLGDTLGKVVAYDARMAEAARRLGWSVMAPA